jgi:hypothetical protein
MIDTIKMCTRRENIEKAPKHAEFYRRLNEIQMSGKYRTLRVSLSSAGSLSLTVSIPQLLYRSSVREYRAEDRGLLIIKLQEILKKLGIRVRDPHEFVLFRVDLCRNLEMPRPAEDYVTHFARYPTPAHWSGPRNSLPASSGFRKNANHWIGVYDKLRKAEKGKKAGMLRVELQLRNRDEVLKTLGFDHLGDLLEYEESYFYLRLFDDVMAVVGPVSCISAPDFEELFVDSMTKGERNGIPLFIISAMAQVCQLAPEDLAAINAKLKQHLSKDSYYRARKSYLRIISAGPFDVAFRKEVIEKLEPMDNKLR